MLSMSFNGYEVLVDLRWEGLGYYIVC